MAGHVLCADGQHLRAELAERRDVVAVAGQLLGADRRVVARVEDEDDRATPVVGEAVVLRSFVPGSVKSGASSPTATATSGLHRREDGGRDRSPLVCAHAIFAPSVRPSPSRVASGGRADASRASAERNAYPWSPVPRRGGETGEETFSFDWRPRSPPLVRSWPRGPLPRSGGGGKLRVPHGLPGGARAVDNGRRRVPCDHLRRRPRIRYRLPVQQLETDATQANIHFENATNNGTSSSSSAGTSATGPRDAGLPGGRGTIGRSRRRRRRGGGLPGDRRREFQELLRAVRGGHDLRERPQRWASDRGDPRPARLTHRVARFSGPPARLAPVVVVLASMSPAPGEDRPPPSGGCPRGITTSNCVFTGFPLLCVPAPTEGVDPSPGPIPQRRAMTRS